MTTTCVENIITSLFLYSAEEGVYSGGVSLVIEPLRFTCTACKPGSASSMTTREKEGGGGEEGSSVWSGQYGHMVHLGTYQREVICGPAIPCFQSAKHRGGWNILSVVRYQAMLN